MKYILGYRRAGRRARPAGVLSPCAHPVAMLLGGVAVARPELYCICIGATRSNVTTNEVAMAAGRVRALNQLRQHDRAFDPDGADHELESLTRLRFMVQNSNTLGTLSRAYREGPRYPRRERIRTDRDRLTEIILPGQL